MITQNYLTVFVFVIGIAASGASQPTAGETTSLRDMALGGTAESVSREEGDQHMHGMVSSHRPNASLVPIPHKAKHKHGMSILHADLLPEERLFWESYSTETFFTTESKLRGALYTHIAALVGAFFFVFPLVLVFWNVHHALYLPALTLHALLIVVSSSSYFVYMGSIRDDLYPNSAFTKMTGILFVGSLVHWLVASIAVGYRLLSSDSDYDCPEMESDEEGSSLSSPTLTLRETNSRFDSFELEDLTHAPRDGHLRTSNNSMLRTKPSPFKNFLNNYSLLKRVTFAFGKTALVMTSLLNWGSFSYFLIYFPTGIATYLCYGQDEFRFNLLAHFIKGGVFFVLGLVTLARYCGAFKGKGWAWNHRFVMESKAFSRWVKLQSKGLCTMELIESGLILFYGCTNIFMEHMASPGGEWSAKDLQHVSIAFIYLGCGLCGVLLERMLANWRFTKAIEGASSVTGSKQLAAVHKATPGFSPNPFPVLTIYWTGVLMSSHEQASSLSSEVHKQWGNLFVLACAFRVITYLYFLIKPSEGKSLAKPVYPITELLVSFGLLAGGATFMESCDSVIYSMEYHGLTSMFTLNICLGLVALIMSWVITIFSIKDALVSRKSSHERSASI